MLPVRYHQGCNVLQRDWDYLEGNPTAFHSSLWYVKGASKNTTSYHSLSFLHPLLWMVGTSISPLCLHRFGCLSEYSDTFSHISWNRVNSNLSILRLCWTSSDITLCTTLAGEVHVKNNFTNHASFYSGEGILRCYETIYASFSGELLDLTPPLVILLWRLWIKIKLMRLKIRR